MWARTALAKPSSLLLSVDALACAFTSSPALPMAMLKPDSREHQHVVGHVADGGDLVAAGMPSMLRQVVDHRALVGVRVGDVEVVGLRAASPWRRSPSAACASASQLRQPGRGRR